MKYFAPSVKQVKYRPRKPWRATVYFFDEKTGEKKQKTRMLPEAKGKRDAQKQAEEWCDELNGYIVSEGERKKEITVKEKIIEYEDWLLIHKIERSTYLKDLSISKNYIYPYIGDKLFVLLDRKEVDEWITELYKKGFSPKTIRNAYAQLKKVYNYYISIDEITNNPFKGVIISKSGSKTVSHMDNEQMDKFLEAVYTELEHDPMYCGCLLAYYAGLRRGEICGLRWRNINFENKTITIDSAIGVAKGGNYTKPPKNISSIRTFPMVEQLYEALKQRYDEIQPEGDWFVIGKENNFMSVQSFTSKFEKLVKAYGLRDFYGNKLTPHKLRHNMASVGIRSGMDIASLSKMMGHASRAMTLDIYGDASHDALKTASEKLALQFSDESDMPASDETAEVLYTYQQKHRPVVEKEEDKARSEEIMKNRYQPKPKTDEKE